MDFWTLDAPTLDCGLYTVALKTGGYYDYMWERAQRQTAHYRL